MMAKAVFRPNELTLVSEKVMISNPVSLGDFDDPKPREEIEDEPVIEEYTGPTAEELRLEAEAFRVQWEAEKKAMIEAAQAEANEIVETAGLSAERDREHAAQEAQAAKSQAQEEAEKIIADAQQLAMEIVSESRSTLDEERKAALEQGREDGRVEGYAEGKASVDRLIERTHTVLERAQDKRSDILLDTEREIIDLVLLITRKVVKVISESQRDVIIANVQEALGKVKDKGTVIIRVNLADLKLATDHIKDFIQTLEGNKAIQVMEDTSVDAGGCIIETDFGEIDARISSQFAELEAKILAISPIKTRLKPRK